MSFLADFLSSVHVSRRRGTDGRTDGQTDGRLAMSFFRANNSLLHIFYPVCAFDVGAKVEAERCNVFFNGFFIRRARFTPARDGWTQCNVFFRANNSLLQIFYLTCVFRVGEEQM